MDCRKCGGKMHSRGTSDKYHRWVCKLCKATAYKPLEKREEYTMKNLKDLVEHGFLKVKFKGKIFDIKYEV